MTTQAIPQAGIKRAFSVNLKVRDWRIRTKLLALLLIFGILPFAMAGGLTFRLFRDTVTQMAGTGIHGTTVTTATAIDQYLANKREDIVVASGSRELATFLELPLLPNVRASALQALKTFSARVDYESVALMSLDGKIVLSSLESDIGTDVAFRPYFIEAAKGNVYISDPSVSVITNRPAIFFSAPVRNTAGEIIGVVRSRLSLDGIWSLVERNKDAEGKGSYGMLLDENGIRIANSLSLDRRAEMEGSQLLYTAVAPLSPEAEQALVKEKRFGNATATKVQVVAIPEVANALFAPGVTTFETSSDVNSERNFAAVSRLSQKPWRYVIMSPFSSFFGEIDLWSRVYLIGTLILIVLIVVTSSYVATTFTTPLNQLTQLADRISLGELDAKIDTDRKDEIGELSEAVSRMQASLQAAIERLRARRTAS